MVRTQIDRVHDNGRVALQVEMTNRRLRDRVGYTDKKRRKMVPLQPRLAAEILRRENYTIDFQPETEEMKRLGFKNIWQYIAYRHPVSDTHFFLTAPAEFARHTSARLHARLMRQSFLAFRKHFLVDHREHPLLMVPRLPGRKQIEIITFDPSYPVNDVQVAYEVFRTRSSDGLKHKVKSVFDMMEATGGIDAMREVASHVETFIREEFIHGQRQAKLPFDE